MNRNPVERLGMKLWVFELKVIADLELVVIVLLNLDELEIERWHCDDTAD